MPESPSAPDWAGKSGDAWATRWRDTDRALERVAAELRSAILANAAAGAFKAFEIGCGPGTTTLQVAEDFADASVIACDISPTLAQIAQRRAGDRPNVRIVTGDAQVMAVEERPLDLVYSRHGVMFFPDPVRAFRTIRSAASSHAALVFSCFQAWELNPWASELACAAAGCNLQPPGREPSGFAFADRGYVTELLEASGWSGVGAKPVRFRYFAGNTVDEALSFLLDVGPASRIVATSPPGDRDAAVERMREVIERQFDGTAVAFPAAAWIWQARAG